LADCAQFFLMIFYTDAALVAPALAGNALLVGKIWDAVNDPLFGWVSDRATSRRCGRGSRRGKLAGREA
jgi:GPH family glycoside/pentoside/hexuronide:cation symporter